MTNAANNSSATNPNFFKVTPKIYDILVYCIVFNGTFSQMQCGHPLRYVPTLTLIDSHRPLMILLMETSPAHCHRLPTRNV